jgi:hypothetical protein
MTDFYFDRKSSCALAKHYVRLLYAISVIGVVCASRATINAAPVTLAFEAIVGPPRQSFDGLVPPEWNILLEEGDTISGSFTFDPFDANSDITNTTRLQPFNFSIHIKNRTITTSQYGIEVLNNVFSDELGRHTDRISVGCSAGASTPSCIPMVLSTPSQLNWTFLLGLDGESSILDGADISSDPFTWRQLIYPESFGVTFVDNIARQSFGFIASPITFEAVPEPISCFEVIIGTLFLLIVGRRAIGT